MRSAAIMAATILAATLALGQTNTTSEPRRSVQRAKPRTAAGNSRRSSRLAGKVAGRAEGLSGCFRQDRSGPAGSCGRRLFREISHQRIAGVALHSRHESLRQSNNTEKVIDTGRKAIAADPTNPIPLVQVASALAETTRDTDLDREQRLAEAAKDAHAAIDNIDTGLILPANADPATSRRRQTQHSHHGLRHPGHDRHEQEGLRFGGDRTCRRRSTRARTIPRRCFICGCRWPRTSCKQYPQALDSANKAVQYAKDGSAAQNLAQATTGAAAEADERAESAGQPAHASPARSSDRRRRRASPSQHAALSLTAVQEIRSGRPAA